MNLTTVTYLSPPPPQPLSSNPVHKPTGQSAFYNNDVNVITEFWPYH